MVTGLEGGLGASSLAALCAAGRARARRPEAGAVPAAVVVDLDAGGAGLDVLLGIEHEPGLRWPDLRDAPSDLDGVQLLRSLPTWRGAGVLAMDRRRSGGVPSALVATVLTALVAEVEVVVDLPRGCWGEALGEAVRTPAGTTSVWLAAPSIVSLGAGQRAAVASGADGLLVRAVRGAALGPQEVAAHLELPLWGVLREERVVRAATEWGRGPGRPLRGAAEESRVRRARSRAASGPSLVAAVVNAAHDELRRPVLRSMAAAGGRRERARARVPA